MNPFIRRQIEGIKRILLVLFILSLLPFIFINIKIILTQIYTPPALTVDKVPVYKELLKMFEKYQEYEHMLISIHDYIIENRSGLSFHSMLDEEEIKKYFPKEDIKQFEQFGSLLKSVRCVKAEKIDDVILFYNHEGMQFMPSAPGVLFSLSGRDPNEIPDETLEQFKPFTHLKNNWYYSPKLVLSRSRKHSIREHIPNALIDHSARLPKGVEL